MSQSYFQKGMLSSVSSSVDNDTATCEHSEGGQRYHASCRSDHTEQTNSSHCHDENVYERNVPVAEQQNAAPSVKPCRYFFRTGRCAYGSDCRFSHCGLALHEVRSQVRDGKPHDTKNTVSSDQSDARGKPKKESDGRKLCWYFKRGHCHFGERCRRSHAAADGEEKDEVMRMRDAGRANGTNLHRRRAPQSQTVPQRGGKDREAKTASQHSELEENRLPAETVSLMQKADKTEDVSDKRETLRTTEIKQLRLRYPRAEITDKECGGTAAKFVFQPSDPDWVNTLKIVIHNIYAAQLN